MDEEMLEEAHVLHAKKGYLVVWLQHYVSIPHPAFPHVGFSLARRFPVARLTGAPTTYLVEGDRQRRVFTPQARLETVAARRLRLLTLEPQSVDAHTAVVSMGNTSSTLILRLLQL